MMMVVAITRAAVVTTCNDMKGINDAVIIDNDYNNFKTIATQIHVVCIL